MTTEKHLRLLPVKKKLLAAALAMMQHPAVTAPPFPAVQGLEKRLIERFDRVDKDIAEVKSKLDKIDDDIRGNGRIG